MKNLINFLRRYSVVFLFIFLEVIALWLISRNKGYHRSLFLTSTNFVAGKMFERSNEVVEFFNLRESNNSLSEENTALLNKLTVLESKLRALTDTTDFSIWDNVHISPEREYSYIPAKVIRLTTGQLSNYITLNKGSNENIRPDMGVIAEDGIVGIVHSVSPHFSKVLPLIHPQSTIISKFKKTNYYGPISWDGDDYRFVQMGDIARHVTFSLGDTIMTGGFKTFPEGIMIGTVENYDIQASDAYYNIKVKLAVDFRRLTHVKVVDYKHFNEQHELENDK